MRGELLIALALAGEISGVAIASDSDTEIEPAKIYRSPEERREAGLGHRVTDWLKISGLVELETERKEDAFHSSISNASVDETSKDLQIGLDIAVSESLKGELVFEYEAGTRHAAMDEGFLEFEFEPWGVEIGRLYVPFGEYYSHFVSGPMLEFGETRGNALVVDYTFDETLQLGVFLLDGEADRTGERNGIDWGAALEITNADESVKIGAGILSDLADTDEKLLDEFDNRYSKRVPGFNAFALIGLERLEITAEITAALRRFRELDSNINEPKSANVELAWFPRPSYQFAVRLEASDELEDQPERRIGISFVWLLGRHVTFGLDYLYGRFRDNFAFDDNDHEIDSRGQFAAQIAAEF